MFNVLVSWKPTAWETDQLMRIEAARFGEFSGSERAAISIEDGASLKRLEGIPPLLLYELGSDGPSAETVRYGTVQDVQVVNGQLQFRFSQEGIFPRALIYEFADRLALTDFERSRTHWAVKDGGIPAALLRQLKPTYDVVLSFAGEDRAYVEQVAEGLRADGVRGILPVVRRSGSVGPESRGAFRPRVPRWRSILCHLCVRTLRRENVDQARASVCTRTCTSAKR